MSRIAVVVGVLVAMLACPRADAQQQLESKVPIAFNRFYTFDELNDLCRKLAEAYPEILSMKEIGRSVQGRPIYAITVNNPATGSDLAKPAMYIDGNIHGNEIQASETVLYTLWYLASAYGRVPAITELVDRVAFYIVPCANPDGRAYWFDAPNNSSSSRGGQRPIDNDHDGVADEDGPDDLDGDGSIGVMWRRDPNGTHKRSELDPGRMESVSPEPMKDGRIRRGEWRFAGSEGIDNDGDGQINEDGPGGYDPNRDWPSDWQPEHVQSGVGAYPLSLPESRAIAAFVLAHPNIAAGQAYHNAGGMILRGPGARDREDTYPARDRATLDAIAKTGEEMLPFYRAMVTWSDLYPVRGGFVNWLTEGVGAMSFTNELWTDKLISKSSDSPDDGATQRWRERMLFDQTTVPLHEVEHPTYGTILVGGGTKYSSRIPPPFMLEEECHRNFAFTMYHAGQMPLVRFGSVDVTDLGGGLWQLDVEITNDRLIPTRTERAANKGIGLPDRLSLEGAKVLVSGRVRDRIDRALDEVRYRPATIEVDEGISGRASRHFRFLVDGPEGASVTLKFDGEKFAPIVTTVPLRATPPTTPPATPPTTPPETQAP